jgi:hypothetical protein
MERSMTEKESAPPITLGFGTVFRRIRKRESFTSPPLQDLGDKMYDALVAAALAKCVEFNVVINRSRRYDDEDFLFVSGLRGICEDLIYLSYMTRMSPSVRTELVKLLIQLNTAEGLDTQHKFFKANNPFQPVLGPAENRLRSGESASVAARSKFRAFWSRQGSSRRDGPTIKEMAHNLGLTSTYDYVYFAASNFSHFNPQSLLRIGWGAETGPFRFSMKHLSGYYKSLSSFYGAVLFLGFHSAFSPDHFDANCDVEVAKLLELVSQIHRWPELVTFEEMNQKPPLFFLTHAIRQVAQKETGSSYGAILEEVRGLGGRLEGA